MKIRESFHWRRPLLEHSPSWGLGLSPIIVRFCPLGGEVWSLASLRLKSSLHYLRFTGMHVCYVVSELSQVYQNLRGIIFVNVYYNFSSAILKESFRKIIYVTRLLRFWLTNI